MKSEANPFLKVIEDTEGEDGGASTQCHCSRSISREASPSALREVPQPCQHTSYLSRFTPLNFEVPKPCQPPTTRAGAEAAVRPLWDALLLHQRRAGAQQKIPFCSKGGDSTNMICFHKIGKGISKSSILASKAALGLPCI